MLPRACKMRQQLPFDHAENRQIAEERTLIVEQCINHGIKQMTIMHCKKLTDQILQRSHAICPQQRLQRCFDAPYAVYGQLLAGPRFAQPGKNAPSAGEFRCVHAARAIWPATYRPIRRSEARSEGKGTASRV